MKKSDDELGASFQLIIFLIIIYTKCIAFLFDIAVKTSHNYPILSQIPASAHIAVKPMTRNCVGVWSFHNKYFVVSLSKLFLLTSYFEIKFPKPSFLNVHLIAFGGVRYWITYRITIILHILILNLLLTSYKIEKNYK